VPRLATYTAGLIRSPSHIGAGTRQQKLQAVNIYVPAIAVVRTVKKMRETVDSRTPITLSVFSRNVTIGYIGCKALTETHRQSDEALLVSQCSGAAAVATTENMNVFSLKSLCQAVRDRISIGSAFFQVYRAYDHDRPTDELQYDCARSHRRLNVF